ncbi:MAG TPA: SBBP repeat-containing protein [Acidobacteriota bacterium]|jgi:hypothetical protein
MNNQYRKRPGASQILTLLVIECFAAAPAHLFAESINGIPKLLRSSAFPLRFEANQGQTDAHVKFLARGDGFALFLTQDEAVVKLDGAVVRLKFSGGNKHARLLGVNPLPGQINYLIGGNRRAWPLNVPTYQRVNYLGLYPGVDLVFYVNQREMEFDFILKPGARPEKIRLEFETTAASPALRIDDAGDLLLTSGGGEMRLRKPMAYQEIDGERMQISTGYRIQDGRHVGFVLGGYDPKRSLTIDPVWVYSSYLGGSRDEQGHAIAVDRSGNAYITGVTTSLDFPTLGGLPGTGSKGGTDIFIAKLNAAGTGLAYATYIGGSGTDYATAIAIDAAGNAYLTGFTNSADFPVSGAIQPVKNQSFDAFVTKLDASGGGIVYSTFLGGGGEDLAAAIAVDSAGNAYISGTTSSTDFRTVNALQTAIRGPSDAFVAKINTAGTALVYSSYFGGTGADGCTAIAIDDAGNAYLAGITTSQDLPTLRPFQRSHGGGAADGFLAKVNPAGGALVYATYLGGSGIDRVLRLAVDSSGNAYAAGDTDSTNFPTLTPLQPAGGGSDAFLSKLNADGTALVYSTYVGGHGNDAATGIALDSAGNVYLSGITTSPDFPTKDAVQSANAGSSIDVFLAKLNAAGTGFIYSTYLGGGDEDLALAMAVDSAGDLYVAGRTLSANFPSVGGFQNKSRGGGEVFVGKLSAQSAPSQTVQYIPRVLSAETGGPSVTDYEETGIAIVNLSDRNAAVTLTAYDPSGGVLSGRGLRNPAGLFLNPGQQVAILARQIFAADSTARVPISWLRLESSARQTAGFFQTFNSDLSILDGADASSTLATSLVFPDIEDQGVTEFHIVNPNNSPAVLTFELLQSDGTQRLPPITRQVNANAIWAESYHDIFSGIRPFAADYVRVTSSQPLLGFELLRKPRQYVKALNGQDAGAGGTVLYSPQYVAGGNQYLSTLSVVNLDSLSGTVTLEFFRDDGTPIGSRRIVPIAAKGKIYVSDQAFFASGTTASQGYVKITSNGIRLTGSVAFGDPGRVRFASALPLVSTFFRSLVFSQLASNQTYFTGVSILNPNATVARVTLEVYDESGVLLGTKTEEIPAAGRTARLLTEFFPQLVGQNRSSGYIKVNSASPLAAFALFGTNDLSVLTAVPAQIVP